MSDYNHLIQLINLKKANLKKIKDLMSSYNTSIKELKQAKETQDFINYKLYELNLGDEFKNKKLPPINIDLSTVPDVENSVYVKYNQTQKDINNNGLNNKQEQETETLFPSLKYYSELTKNNGFFKDYCQRINQKQLSGAPSLKKEQTTLVRTPTASFKNQENIMKPLNFEQKMPELKHNDDMTSFNPDFNENKGLFDEIILQELQDLVSPDQEEKISEYETDDPYSEYN